MWFVEFIRISKTSYAFWILQAFHKFFHLESMVARRHLQVEKCLLSFPFFHSFIVKIEPLLLFFLLPCPELDINQNLLVAMNLWYSNNQYSGNDQIAFKSFIQRSSYKAAKAQTTRVIRNAQNFSARYVLGVIVNIW